MRSLVIGVLEVLAGGSATATTYSDTTDVTAEASSKGTAVASDFHCWYVQYMCGAQTVSTTSRNR